MAIAHKEGNTVILDLIREVRPPFSPEQVVEEFAAVARRYRISKVVGDRYGGEWPRERFRMHGCNYELVDQTKSEIYQALLPIINSCSVRLLDHDRMLHQFVGLERRTSRGGRDSIDHVRGGHDDVANAVAGTIILANSRPSTFRNRLRDLDRISSPISSSSGSTDGTGWMRQ
jgi:hypothetical protein